MPEFKGAAEVWPECRRQGDHKDMDGDDEGWAKQDNSRIRDHRLQISTYVVGANHMRERGRPYVVQGDDEF